MRKSAAIAIAALSVGFGSFTSRVFAEAAPPSPAPVPAPADAAVPVKRVVLYTSGVGYFEHFGTVHGDANTVLSFKTDQINDVLKSLLLEDLDGGHVTGVSYPTAAPLEQTLKSFQVDLSNDPPLADILKQLRGAKITVGLPTGPVAGEVLGVEEKDRAIGAGPDAKVARVWMINLLNDSGIVPVELAQVTQVKLDDPKLAGEMQKALEAVALSRDKDKKPVTISFTGQGDHRVRVGYVVETPIWKASYRLSLGGAGAATAPADEPQADQKALADVPAEQRGRVQGWAIVDNQTDNDWTGIELALVSGRPISFIEDLYQPLYVPRPTVTPDLFLGLVPQTYAQGVLIDKEIEQKEFPTLTTKFGDEDYHNRVHRSDGQNVLGFRGDSAGDSILLPSDDLDDEAGVQSLASSAKVGEAFEYTVHDVSLARQKSSMIPILSGPMQTQRLSIYNPTVLPSNPLLGARLTNISGEYLMQGPVTILDHGIYAGDAQILDMPPRAKRLISYGVDQRMQINGGDAQTTSKIVSAKFVKGDLQVSMQGIIDQVYTATNKADSDKLLLIEHPRQPDWQLVTPAKAVETTDTVDRFELPVPAGKTASLEVKESHTYWETVQILPVDTGTLLSYTQNAAIPQPVKDALAKAIQLRQAVADSDAELAQLAKGKADLSAEQDRMRKNMEAVSPSTDYYKKLLKKLDDQETQFEQMETHEKQLMQEKQDREKQLNDYLSNLNVG